MTTNGPMTTQQFADKWQISAARVRSLIHSGKLAAVAITTPGKTRPSYRITVEAEAAWIAASTTRPAPQQPRRKPAPSNVIKFFQ